MTGPHENAGAGPGRSDECDVLVVGAGPTGLALALDLARHGVAVRLVDRSTAYDRGSRGREISPRTLEVLDDLGVAGRVLAHAVPATRLRVHDESGLLADLSWYAERERRPGVPYPSPVLVPQGELERILRERLAEQGIDVEQGLELRRIRQERAGVEATFRGRSGLDVQIRSAYLVGADGRGSTVRGLVVPPDADGPTAPARGTVDTRAAPVRQVYAADVVVDGIAAEDVTQVWYSADGGVSVLSPNPGIATWAVRISADAGAGQVREPSRGFLEDLFRRRTGWDRVRFVDAHWLATHPGGASAGAGGEDQLVEAYFGAGRVFLAGDAAHAPAATSGAVMAAPGLNAGIQDAYNLGWKLAAVVRGADAELLDSYPAERASTARMRDLAPDLTQALLGRRGQPLRGPLRAALAGLLRVRPYARWALAGQLARSSGLDLHYRESRLSQRLGGRRVLLRAGDRMPDVRLWSPARAAEVRMFDLLRGPRWTVVGLGTVTAEAVSAVLRQYGARAVRGEVVGGGWSAVRGVTLLDRYGEASHLLGRRGDTLFVVRPDGYIGLVSGSNSEIATAYLEDLLRGSPGPDL